MPASRRSAFPAISLDLVASLGVAAVTFLVFSPALGDGWVDYDDDQNFLANPHYRGLGPRQLRWMLSGVTGTRTSLRSLGTTIGLYSPAPSRSSSRA